MKTKTYKVYWIYDDRMENPDPFKDGYIGVTSATHISHRVASHKSTKYNHGAVKSNYTRQMYTILNSIPNKHITYELLYESSDPVEAAAKEKVFRPKANIGWNIHAGGKKISIPRAIIITSPDGNEYTFKSLGAARRAGWDDSTLSKCLRDNHIQKTFNAGHTVRYA